MATTDKASEAASPSWRERFTSFLEDRVTSEANVYAHEKDNNVAFRSLPIIMVDKVGRISFPLSKEQASRIIDVAAESKFGMGEKTLLDDSVRKSWELEPSQVTFGEKKQAWAAKLESIVVDAAKALGLTREQRNCVRCELHKVLLYEEGGFFKPHRDSEKKHGMFATLAIQLPSQFEGGAMVIEHQGTKHHLNLEKSSDSALQWITWYADCLHEVEPITSGHRLVLVYNLLKTGVADGAQNDTGTADVQPYSPSTEDMSTLRGLVEEWKKRVEVRILNENLPAHDDLEWQKNDFVNDICFVHRLDHLYTVAGWKTWDDRGGWDDVGFTRTLESFKLLYPHESSDPSRLKGRDRNIVELLSKAPVEVTLVIQDFSGGYGERVEVERKDDGEEYQHPLWSVSWCDDSFRLAHRSKTLCRGKEPSEYFYRFKAAEVPDIEMVGNHGQPAAFLYRVAFLIIRPML